MHDAVIVSPDPTSAAGGVERVCALVAGTLEADGWTVQTVGPEREPARWLSRVGAGYLANSWSATRAASKHRPDIVITNGFLGLSLPGGPPRVHIYHGTMVNDTRAEAGALTIRERTRRTIGSGLAEAVAGRGAFVVCVSQATADEVRRFYRVKTDLVIPNAIDTSIFAPRDTLQSRARLGLEADGRYALFVGREQQRKGSDLLMRATSRAGFELLIAGATAVPGARHLGILDPDSLADAYGAADCVLFPTRYEGFGLVALEALACERPLLMTKVGWMPTFLEAVPQYEVLCIEPNVDDIVDRLKALGQIDLESLTGRAREFVVENNSLERYSGHWRELLGKLAL